MSGTVDNECKVTPVKHGITFTCDMWMMLPATEIEHEKIAKAIEYLQKYLPAHSKRENIDFYLLKQKENIGYDSPVYTLLLVHNHFEHFYGIEDTCHLVPLLNILNELTDKTQGDTRMVYLNYNYEKMIIEIEGVNEGDLIEEFIRKAKTWQRKTMECEKESDLVDENNHENRKCNKRTRNSNHADGGSNSTNRNRDKR